MILDKLENAGQYAGLPLRQRRICTENYRKSPSDSLNYRLAHKKYGYPIGYPYFLMIQNGLNPSERLGFCARDFGSTSCIRHRWDAVPHLRHSRYTAEGAMPVTDAMKEIILESVNYTLENPFTVPEPIVQKDPGEDDVINVLMIGNSFCNYYPDELKAMADAAGKKLEVYNVYYGGCKLSQHYKFLKNDMPEYSFKHNGVKQKDEVSLWYCISQKNWDYISLQEGSSVLRDAASAQAGMDSNLKYFSHMYEWLKQRCPKSQIIWHQTWAYQVGTTSGGYVTKDAAQQAAYHERLYTYAEMITERYPDLLLVNSGDAWAILRGKGYDKLCNRLGKAVEGAELHTGDNYHEGDIGGGQYLNACVWYEVLFGESCVGNTFRPSYTYNSQPMDMLITVEELQQAAHQAVTARNAN